MDSDKELSFLPIAISLPAWDRAVERFSIAEWEYRQIALIQSAFDAWNKREFPSDEMVTFSLTMFIRLGNENIEQTESFVVKCFDEELIISLVT